jgi:hypothetical protein
VNDELDALCRETKRDRPLRRSHWTSATITDDASAVVLAARIKEFGAAGLDRLILAFPRESATEMISRIPV